MIGSSATQVPVLAGPLPGPVRDAVHELVKLWPHADDYGVNASPFVAGVFEVVASVNGRRLDARVVDSRR